MPEATSDQATVGALMRSATTAMSALSSRPDAPFGVVIVGATDGQMRRIRAQIFASHRWVSCEIERAADLARARAAG